MANISNISLSASVDIEEKEVRLPKTPTLGTTKTGMILNSNWGEAKKVVAAPNKATLVETFDKPNKYNEKTWFCAHDYLTQGASELYIVRPIPDDALNNSIKLTGSFGLSDSVTKSQPAYSYYNQDVAKYSIERLHNLTDAELEIVHRYVTTKENTAVVICSDELYWNQPISNEEIDVVRDVDMNYTPINLVDGESYQIKYDQKSIPTDVTNTTSTFKITAPSTKLEAGDVIRISGATDALNNKTFTVGSYNTTTRLVTLSTGQTLNSAITDGVGYVNFVSGKLTAYQTTVITIASVLNNTITITGDVTTTINAEKIMYINGKFYVVLTSVFGGGNTTVTFKGTTAVDNVTTGYLMTASVDTDILRYNSTTSNFVKISYSLNDLIFIEKRGYVYKVTDESPFTLSRTNLEYYLVDENRDNKGEYAVKKIYKSVMYNSNRSLKTFAQIFDTKPNFSKNEFAIAVFLKDDSDGLYALAEKFVLSYDETAKSSSGRSKYAQNVILDDSKLIYVKVGTKTYSVNKIEYTAGKNIITINGNVAHLKEYRTFELADCENSDNDGIYTIDYTTYDQGTDTTEIYIKEDVTLTAEDGDNEEVVLTITSGASSAGNITVTVGTEVTTIAVLDTDDTPEEVATKIETAFSASLIWDVVRDVAELTFTRILGGSVSDMVFSGGTTGVAGTAVVTTQGTASPASVIIKMGQVSTNRCVTADRRNSLYEPLDTDPKIGKSITDLTLTEISTSAYYKKDFSMVNTWEDGANYGVLLNTDLDAAADVFANKDNVDIQILIGFMSKDENGILSINKMAEIADERKDCLAIIGPFNENEFFGKTNAQIVDYLVNNYGGQRENLFGGEFTKFSSYAACYGNMKLIRNTYSDKDIWTSVCGDIAGMLTSLISIKGPWNALAGPENGLFLNAKQMIFNPTKEERDELSQNSINHIYFCREVNRPIIFEQFTSTLDTESLYRNMNIRTLLISLKEFAKRTLIFKLFKNNTDYERSEAIERMRPIFERIKNGGGLDQYLLICDSTNNTAEVINAGNFAFDIRLVPTKVIRHINLVITSFDYGIDIQEYEER